MSDIIDEYIRRMTRLPRPGIGAANLTDRDRLALFMAAGGPVETSLDGGMFTVRSLVDFGVADRGDGGYIVAMCSRGGRDVAPRADGGS